MIVGLVVLTGIIVALSVSLWLKQDHHQAALTPYTVYFSETVSGLPIGSAVKYRGIRVGSISDIHIPRKNSESIAVSVMIDKNTPVGMGRRASLQMAGITGESYLEISGAVHDDGPVSPPAGESVPVIPSEESSIQKIVSTTPALLTHADQLIQRTATVVSVENRAKFSKILENVQDITQALSDSRSDYSNLMSNFRVISEEMRTTLQSINGAMESLNFAGKNIDHFVQDVRPHIASFAENELPNFVLLTDKLMATLGDLRDVLRTIEPKIEYFTRCGRKEL